MVVKQSANYLSSVLDKWPPSTESICEELYFFRSTNTTTRSIILCDLVSPVLRYTTTSHDITSYTIHAFCFLSWTVKLFTLVLIFNYDHQQKLSMSTSFCSVHTCIQLTRFNDFFVLRKPLELFKMLLLFQ